MRVFSFIYSFLFVQLFFLLFFSCNPAVSLDYEVKDLTVIPMDGQVLLSWVEPSDQKGYDHTSIFWGEINTFNKKLDRFKGELLPAHTLFSSLTNGTEYTFMIVVVDKFGNESPGITRRSKPMDSIKPNEISDFQSEIGSGAISLSWINPSDQDFIKSEVWATDRFGVNTEHFFVSGSPGGSSSIEIGRLENGYNYNFFVKAIDSFGNCSKIAYISANPDGTPPPAITYILGSSYSVRSTGGKNYIPTGAVPSPLPPTKATNAPENSPTKPPSGSGSIQKSWIGKEVELKWVNPNDPDFDRVEVWYGPNGQMKKFYVLPMRIMK